MMTRSTKIEEFGLQGSFSTPMKTHLGDVDFADGLLGAGGRIGSHCLIRQQQKSYAGDRGEATEGMGRKVKRGRDQA
jgi:hypothetical protein